MGDSLAAGVTPYHSIDKGYVDFLVNRYKQSQYEIKLDNYGVPGYRTTHIVNERLDPTNSKDGTLRESIKNAELITHGQYHRGLINHLLRQNTQQPVGTDYIIYKREKK